MSTSTPMPWETIADKLNHRQILSQFLDQIEKALSLRSVKSCVMIGCGSGYTDLELICRCMPNLRQITAVEPDPDQLKKLKPILAQLLPTVSATMCQETAEAWKGTVDNPVDVVLLFHCLYYINASERQAVFHKLFDSVVGNGGLVLMVFRPCSCFSTEPGVICRLVSLLGSSTSDHIDVSEVKKTMSSAGFQNCYELQDMKHQLDFDEDFMSMVVTFYRGSVSLQQVRDTVEQLCGSKTSAPHQLWFGAFRKP